MHSFAPPSTSIRQLHGLLGIRRRKKFLKKESDPDQGLIQNCLRRGQMIKVGGWQMFRGQIFSPRWLQPWFILPNLGRGAKKLLDGHFPPCRSLSAALTVRVKPLLFNIPVTTPNETPCELCSRSFLQKIHVLGVSGCVNRLPRNSDIWPGCWKENSMLTNCLA